jgi:hypothetical protein
VSYSFQSLLQLLDAGRILAVIVGEYDVERTGLTIGSDGCKRKSHYHQKYGEDVPKSHISFIFWKRKGILPFRKKSMENNCIAVPPFDQITLS